MGGCPREASPVRKGWTVDNYPYRHQESHTEAFWRLLLMRKKICYFSGWVSRYHRFQNSICSCTPSQIHRNHLVLTTFEEVFVQMLYHNTWYFLLQGCSQEDVESILQQQPACAALMSCHSWERYLKAFSSTQRFSSGLIIPSEVQDNSYSMLTSLVNAVKLNMT